MTAQRQVEWTTYLGFKVEVRSTGIVVHTPDGRREIGRTKKMTSARRLVRDYRRA